MKFFRAFIVKIHPLTWVILLALALRLFKLSHAYYGTVSELFRDLIVLFDMWAAKKPVLLGPTASVGSFNFGAVYYYLMFPFWFISRFRPLGALLTSTFFSVASICLLYRLTRLWFPGRLVALLASFAAAVSIFDVQNAYYVSNPNLMPFFLLLFFYSLTKILIGERRTVHFLLAGLSFGIATQLHATALLILPILLISAVLYYRPKVSLGRALEFLGFSALTFLPYVIYEAQHHWRNLSAVFFVGQHSFGFVKLNSLQSIIRFWDSLFFFKNDFFNLLVLNRVLYFFLLPFYLLIPLLVWWWFHAKRVEGLQTRPVVITAVGRFLLLTWIGLTTLMFVFYRGSIPPFYFLILWPVPAMLLAWFLVYFFVNSRKLFAYILTVFLLTQAVQLAYFFKLVEHKQFDHGRLLKLFEQIASDMDGHSVNVINATDHVNLFLYYLRLSGLHRVVRPKADFVYLIYNQDDDVSLYPNPKVYRQIRNFSNGDFVVIKYEKFVQ